MFGPLTWVVRRIASCYHGSVVSAAMPGLIMFDSWIYSSWFDIISLHAVIKCATVNTKN